MKSVHYHKGKFPPAKLDWEQILPLIGPANRALARYDGLLSAIPNIYVLLNPLTKQEAVLSSRIEGTQATLGEVLQLEAGVEPLDSSQSKRDDITEVINYGRAMMKALELLDSELPMCGRVLRDVHKVLMSGARGQNSAPGEYKKTQNWIGPKGCSADESRFVPASPIDLDMAMGNWERFVHDDYKDDLVKIALLHAEFEAIHPFLDGNGRLGRMLIPLLLYNFKLLPGPVFYISAYFESDRETYYERLLEVSSKDDWSGWVKYFLTAIIQQAKENELKTRSIVNLKDRTLNTVADITKSASAPNVVDVLFQSPIFAGSEFIKKTAIAPSTARRILKILKYNGLLIEIKPARGRSTAFYGFRELLNIVEGREII